MWHFFDGFAVGMLVVLHENETIKLKRGWQRWHCLSSALVGGNCVCHVVMVEAKVPTKGTTRGGGSPNQWTEGREKRQRCHLRGGGRPSGNMATNQTREAPRCNKRQGRWAEVRLEGKGGWCASQHDNQTKEGGATVQQEVAATGEGMTRRGGRLGRLSTQNDNQPNYMAAMRGGGVMRGGVRPRRRAVWSNAKQLNNQQRTRGRGTS